MRLDCWAYPAIDNEDVLLDCLSIGIIELRVGMRCPEARPRTTPSRLSKAKTQSPHLSNFMLKDDLSLYEHLTSNYDSEDPDMWQPHWP